MDKFDDFLKKKAKNENNEFVLSQSFDLKIEETLKCLEDVKKEKWYMNKKIISTAACFMLVFFIGLRYTAINSNLRMKNGTMIDITSDNVQKRDINNPNVESYEVENAKDIIINQDDVNGLNIKSLSEKSKFKFVDKKEDIENIINYINNIYKLEVIDQDVSKELDFLIQTSGSVNHTIEIKGNLINIDNRYYEAEEDISKIISDIYSNLNYEENDISYCNITY